MIKRIGRRRKSSFPDTDPSLCGGEKFRRVSQPVDYCTVRQAQQHADRGHRDSLLEDIASGKIESRVYSQQEARAMLNAQKRRSSRERGG